jgi:hypothetical protein
MTITSSLVATLATPASLVASYYGHRAGLSRILLLVWVESFGDSFPCFEVRDSPPWSRVNAASLEGRSRQ